jgi:hypothetical protein
VRYGGARLHLWHLISEQDHRCAHCAESRLLLSVSKDLPWSLDSEEEQRICDYQLYDAGKDPKKM